MVIWYSENRFKIEVFKFLVVQIIFYIKKSKVSTIKTQQYNS